MVDELIAKLEEAASAEEGIQLSEAETLLVMALLKNDMNYAAFRLAAAARECLIEARAEFWTNPAVPLASEYWRLHNAAARAIKPLIEIGLLELED